MSATTRECPIEGCPTKHPTKMLMCKPHWYSVPAELRQKVWATYDRGRGILTEEYSEARDAAIHAAETG